MDHYPYWPSKHHNPDVSRDKACYHEDEIRVSIIDALKINNHGDL
jgi:hypothetical protein